MIINRIYIIKKKDSLLVIIIDKFVNIQMIYFYVLKHLVF